MASILDNCVGAARKEFAAGTVLLSEGETSGRLYVLAEGSASIGAAKAIPVLSGR